MQVRNITFMTGDPERLADFWAAVLELPARHSTPDEVIVHDGEWRFPRLTFQRIDDGPRAPSPMHLDLTPADRLDAVARLIALGAAEVATHGDEFRWTVMRDPDGNEFCVTDAESRPTATR